MMQAARAFLIVLAAFGSLVPMASAAVLEGPGRFCGYSPIIDLADGEKITTLQGGIHGGSFQWDGSFGTMDVSGIGWAAQPKGSLVVSNDGQRPARFAQKRLNGRYVIAIWNGKQGAAYFWSDTRFTKAQIEAIDRVRLYQEGEEPEGCRLRTVFSWDALEVTPESSKALNADSRD